MAYKQSQVGKQNFKLIETELRNYRNSIRDLKEIEDSILYASGGGSEIRGSGLSDTTSSKAIKLVSNVYLRELQRRVEAIQYGIDVFKATGNVKKYEFIKLKYFEGKLNNYGIMLKLDLDAGMLYRWRKELVELIANRLGWKVD